MSRGARGIHDQRRAVGGDVDRWRRGAHLNEQVFVSQDRLPGLSLRDDHRTQRRSALAHGRSHGRKGGLGNHGGGTAVLDQVRQFRCCEPEVHRDRDGAEGVGGQDGLHEFGAVEHENHHPVAGADTPAVQCAGESADPDLQLRPRGGAPSEPQRGRLRLHQCVAGELGDPVLSTGQVRLLGPLDTRCSHPRQLAALRRRIGAKRRTTANPSEIRGRQHPGDNCSARVLRLFAR